MSAPLSPLELRIEISKRLSNAGFDFLERLCDRRAVAEQYFNGDGDVHIHLFFSGRAWCANYICGRTGMVAENNGSGFYVYETVVFVEVVEIPKICGPLASLIRLKPLDHCYMAVTDSLEEGLAPSIKSLSLAFDRKLGARWLAASVEKCKSVDEIIERAAEIIADLPNEDCRSGRDGDYGCFAKARAYDKIVRRIGVKLGDESILVFPCDGSESLPKISKVFFCPSYTKEAAIKAVTGCDTLHE